MISGRLTVAPWGTFAGAPVLALWIEEEIPAPDRVRDLVRSAAGRHPGLAAVWIDKAPWAHEAMASLIDSGLADVPSIYATQRITAATWGFRELHWFLDCSLLLDSEASAAGIEQFVARLPGFPAPAELLVRDPLDANLEPHILNVVADRCGQPETMNELQVRATSFHRAMLAASRCRGMWRVRVLSPVNEPSLVLFEE